MSVKIEVTKEFVEQSFEMAQDLYGLAQLNKNKDLKRKLMKHIVKCGKYIGKLEVCLVEED